MTTIHKAITEESEHINKVKKIVKDKASKIEKANLKESPLALGSSWKDLAFSHPERTIRLATAFSGIGAIEHAFQRLGLNYNIVFAGDIDAKCKQSYFANYEITEDRWFSDIREFHAEKYKDQVDILVGGAPCQAFSFGIQRLLP